MSHLFLEADLKNPVSLVDHQTLEAVVDKPLRVLGEKRDLCKSIQRERFKEWDFQLSLLLVRLFLVKNCSGLGRAAK